MTKRTAVITGGAGGMGLCCARRLAPHYQILLAEIDEARLTEGLAVLSEEGIKAIGLPTDISEPASVADLATRAAELGEFGALVHTAGLSPTMAPGDRIWQVNLVGSALLMEAFRPQVIPGSVAVLIASQAGHFIGDGATSELHAILDDPLATDLLQRIDALSPTWLEPGSAYGGAKLGVIRLAVRAALDWGPSGGRVVSLSPGIIDTGMGQQEYAAQPFMATMVDVTPLGRMGEDDEIAKAVEFLCSDAASFVTATDLLVDGGSTQAVRQIKPAVSPDS
ncbi:SDR family oxidoreductase [Myxococcota bacterium]|nr:SDR family oxidoreductase [Myxococcota bacterium]